ncbi:MAG: hypothetical protein ABNG98_04280 [Flavobacterium sp.]|jgi:hypothetical protein
MKYSIILFLSVFFFFSCNTKKEESAEEVTKTSEDFEMYQMSEMATLMEQMYVDNERLKDRIIKGDTVGQFPQHFTKIHEAVLTDDTDKDTFFKEQASKFILAQELIYKDPKNAKRHFNNGVNACIECHQVKCGGPIPRIKKLYIN